MTLSAQTTVLERWFSVREIEEAGLGDRQTTLRRIHSGDVPAVKFANSYKIRESDLHLLADAGTGVNVAVPVVTKDTDVVEYIKALVDAFSKLTDEEKNELGRLLSAAT